MPESLSSAPKNANGLGSDFSLERLDVLDSADVIVVLGFSIEPTDELLINPLFTRLPAVAAGRIVRVEQGPVAQALAIQSPPQLRYGAADHPRSCGTGPLATTPELKSVGSDANKGMGRSEDPPIPLLAHSIG
ncbi:MAG: hypothetical protein Fur005_43730 [Roseiflexaceae bacterium]